MSDTDVALFFMQFARRQSAHSIASVVFLLYDLLTTLDEEVEYVWRSANTLPKYLYFISRYFGLLGQLILATNVVPMFCFGYLMVSFAFLFTLILSVELSLMLRIDALYGKSRRVRIVMGIAFLVEWAISLWFNISSFPRIFRVLIKFPSFLPVKGCIALDDVTLYKLSWVPVLAFETVLFALNSVKCISYGPLDNTPLIYRLFRDGSVYYAIIFVFMLVCTIAQFIDTSLATVMVTWISVVFSYSGCHLLLSVRKIAARRRRLDMTHMIPVSALRIEGPDSGDSSPLEGNGHTLPLLPPHLPPRLSGASRIRPLLHRQGQGCAENIELVPRLGHVPLAPRGIGVSVGEGEGGEPDSQESSLTDAEAQEREWEFCA